MFLMLEQRLGQYFSILMQSRSLDVHGLKKCFDLLLAFFQIWFIPEQLWLLGCSGRRSWKPRQRWGDNEWASLVISFEKVVFLIHVSGSFILTKPKWDQILFAFKIGEIISCYRGFQMDWSSLHLWVGAALYSCKSEQILETKEQEKWSKVVKSYWITFVCILVLFDFNGCRAISESHILPDGLLGRLCCGNAGSRLALFIGCFMGQTKMPWKIGRAVVVYPSQNWKNDQFDKKSSCCLKNTNWKTSPVWPWPRFIGWRELKLRTAGTPKLQSRVKSMASWNKIKNR